MQTTTAASRQLFPPSFSPSHGDSSAGIVVEGTWSTEKPHAKNCRQKDLSLVHFSWNATNSLKVENTALNQAVL